jgi:hypothetical protein
MDSKYKIMSNMKGSHDDKELFCSRLIAKLPVFE